MNKSISSALCFFIFILTNSFGQSDEDRIKQACFNYITGFYQGDTTLLSASLSPDLYKFGYFKYDGDIQHESAGQMTYKAAIEYALKVKTDGAQREVTPEETVQILDISDHIAAAKVKAWWGIDYIHLSKRTDGTWLIEQVLWEGPRKRLSTGEVVDSLAIDSFYYQIPDAPNIFNEHTAIARVVDGLGFRYYWATEGLRDVDLSFAPAEGSRDSRATLEHIFGLTGVVLNAIKGKPNASGGIDVQSLSWSELRYQSLKRIKTTSDLLKVTDPVDMSDYSMIFQRGDTQNAYPFWNVLNGPLADAIWHVGQVVSYRRLSGNPFDSKVSVLSGKRRD